MTTKRQIIENQIAGLQDYWVDNKMIFFSRIAEAKKHINTEQVVGIVEKYLLPAYREQLLKEYIQREIYNIKTLVLKASGLTLSPEQQQQIVDYQLDDRALDELVKRLTLICKVLLL